MLSTIVIPSGMSFQQCDQPCFGFLMLSGVFTSPDCIGRGIGLLDQFWTNHSRYILISHSLPCPSIIKFRSTENKNVASGNLCWGAHFQAKLFIVLGSTSGGKYLAYNMSSTTAVSGECLIRSGGRLDIEGDILRDGFLDILSRASLQCFIGSLRVQVLDGWSSGGSGASHC